VPGVQAGASDPLLAVTEQAARTVRTGVPAQATGRMPSVRTGVSGQATARTGGANGPVGRSVTAALAQRHGEGLA